MKLRVEFKKEQYGPDDLEKQLGKNWTKRLWEAMLINTIVIGYPQGMPPAETRATARILEALDAAIVFAEITATDLDFLNHVFFNPNALVHPSNARVFCAIQDALEQASQVE